jgi:hypothetical protein
MRLTEKLKMELKLIGILDKKANVINHIRTYRSSTDALRAAQVAANSDKSELNSYPDDYQVVQLGTVDDETGEMTSDKNILDDVINLIKKPSLQEV